MKKRPGLIYVLDHPASLRGTGLLAVSCAMTDPNEKLARMYCPMKIKVQCYVRPGYTAGAAVGDACLLFGDSLHQNLPDVIEIHYKGKTYKVRRAWNNTELTEYGAKHGLTVDWIMDVIAKHDSIPKVTALTTERESRSNSERRTR